MKLSVTKIRSFFDHTHRDDSGAVALLCLAAVLALMLIAWMILDVHTSTRDKVMLQGAADTAAFSHASVEARSMNMISYANIAKRSVVGIHSLYPSMMAAYMSWIAIQVGRCIASWFTDVDACRKAIQDGTLAINELSQDHVSFSGNPFAPYADAVISNIRRIINFIPGVSIGGGGSLSTGNSVNAHAQDLRALDNYQTYMRHITPWWAWSEQLARAWRNGATTAASFPPPPGNITVTLSAVQDVINTVNGVLAMFGAPTVDLTVYHGNDNLPVTKKEYYPEDWWLGGPMASATYVTEHGLNAAVHYNESDPNANNWFVMTLGPTAYFLSVGLPYSDQVFGELAWPHEIDTSTITSEADWLEHTSNLVFAYSNDPTRMDEARAKFSVPSKEYELSGGRIDELMYGSSGYWTMSKSEITYNGDNQTPDMWHPSWTARMRPVHLPDEFDDAGYNMNTAYNQALPYLALSAQVASVSGGAVDAILNSIRDFAMMELHTAAMGPSTAGGIAK